MSTLPRSESLPPPASSWSHNRLQVFVNTAGFVNCLWENTD